MSRDRPMGRPLCETARKGATFNPTLRSFYHILWLEYRMVARQKARKITAGRKFSQVREGARKVFLREGYAGASVDDIARAAKVSKATLYAYFPDKRLMFEAVFQAEIDRLAARSLDMADAGPDAAGALARLSVQIAEWLVSERETQVFRLALSEAGRFPDLASAYHDCVRAAITVPLRRILDDLVSRRELAIGDTEIAAEQLVRLCGAAIRDRALLGVGKTDDAVTRQVGTEAAKLFYNAHRPVSVTATAA